MAKAMISVICITYNHEKYIAQAIESFLAQKTTVPFEIVILDDVSTDNTTNIVRSYAQRYPDIIKAIYPPENLRSRKIGKLPYLAAVASGKYVAVCEGDDYWIDEQKLQKQFDYMEAHPECTLCIHNSQIVNNDRTVVGAITPCMYSREIAAEEVICGGGGFCATNSIFTKAELYFHRPEYFKILSLDYILQVYLATSGMTYCFQEKMSAYRVNVEGSWTSRMGAKNARPQMIAHLKLVEQTLTAFDEHTKYLYHDAVVKAQRDSAVKRLCAEGNSAVLTRPYFKGFLKVGRNWKRMAIVGMLRNCMKGE